MSLTSPSTEKEIFEYVKTTLGEPIIKVDVHDNQMKIRLHEALEKFEQFHYSGTEQLHLVHRITAQDVSRGWIETPEDVTGVTGALGFDRRPGADMLWWNPGMGVQNSVWLTDSGRAGGHGSVDVGVGNYGITNAVTLFLNDMQRAHFENILCPEEAIRWNELTRRLYFDTDVEKLVVDTYVVVEVYSSVFRQEPNGLKNALKCDWLKRYFAALVKLQWGTNLSKFSGGTIFGGSVTVNGEKILADAQAEVSALDEELMTRWLAQPRMFVG